jgi:hypothetical protein
MLFQQNKAEDPKREGRSNFLVTWYDNFSNEPKLLREVLGGVVVRPSNDDDMDEAIHDLLPNGNVTTRNLSVVIRKFAGQWIDGYRILPEEVDTKSRKSKRWLVECQLS